MGPLARVALRHLSAAWFGGLPLAGPDVFLACRSDQFGVDMACSLSVCVALCASTPFTRPIV